MLTLYHAIPSRSSIVRWMLEEVGQPYEVRLLDLQAGDNRSADYLAVNPMGKVPALDHDGAVITEAAAICAYLADEFPAAKLAVPVGTPQRGVYLKWLFYSPSCLETAMIDKGNNRPPVPPRQSSYGDFDTVMDTVAQAVKDGPYLMGQQFTAADVVLGSCLQYGILTKALPERPEFMAYLGRLRARPALQRSFAKNQALFAELHPTG